MTMTSRNTGRWIRNLLRATVLDDVWPEILCFSLVATIVCVVSDKTSVNLGISSVLLTVLGNVIVLQTILSLRTSSANERYQEGRMLWSSLATNSKNLAQTIWIHVPNMREGYGAQKEGDILKGILEKRSIINLIQALVVSVKHFVRDEPGVDYEDLYPLLWWLAAFPDTSSEDQPWYKSDPHPSSTTLLNEPGHSRLRTRRSASSFSTLNSGSSVEDLQIATDSDVSRSEGGLRILRTTSPVQTDETTPLTQHPTIPTPGDPCSLPHNPYRFGPEQTLVGSGSDSPAPRHRVRPLGKPKFEPRQCRYRCLNPDPLALSDSDSENEEVVRLAALRRPKQVRFYNSDTLVDPPVPDRYDSKKLNSGGIISSSTKSHDSFPMDYPDQSTYDRILPHVQSLEQLKPAANPPPESLRDVFPLWRFLVWIGRWIRNIVTWNFKPEDPSKRRKRNPYVMAESSVPLQIWLALSSYLSYLNNNKLIPAPAIQTSITNYILNLQDITAQLERLTNTPLPFAYQVHMRMSVWLYLLFLPFQIYDNFGYLTIPLTAFTTFVLTGFIEIGQEIENPFDYDDNDLDLDYFCLQLQRELHEITAQIHPNHPSFLFSSQNFPFAPTDRRSADILAAGDTYCGAEDCYDPHTPSIERTMLSCWKEINEVTREWVYK